MNNNRYILNELNKGIKMGMDSISNVSEKVKWEWILFPMFLKKFKMIDLNKI